MSIKVLVVTPGDGSEKCMPFAHNFVASLHNKGVSVKHFWLLSRMSPLTIIKECNRFKTVMHDFNPDVVHAYYGTVTSTFCAICSNRPLVITYHGSDLNPSPGDNYSRHYLSHLLSQISAVWAKRIIVVSKQLRELLLINKNRVDIIPCGINMNHFNVMERLKARQILGWNRTDKIVLFNARTDPIGKRLDLAETAMGRVRNSIPIAKLFVFRGETLPSKMPLYYNAADALLMTSDYEGSPMVIKEALACNLPIVSVDVGDVSERLEGVHLSYIVSRDPNDISVALVKVLTSSLRSNGRDVIKKISEENVAQQVINLYESILL